MSFRLDRKMVFHQMRGVGTLELDWESGQRVYALIGENGIGKTKLLESLVMLLFLTSQRVENFYKERILIYPKYLLFNGLEIGNYNYNPGFFNFDDNTNKYLFIRDVFPELERHQIPFVYLAAQSRSNIQEHQQSVKQLGRNRERLEGYLTYLSEAIIPFDNTEHKLKTLSMDTNIEEWFVQRAQSANPYQAAEDNREIEIKTLLTLLHRVDERIDAEFLEISGDNRVFLKIETDKRALSQLSSGFVSILKILQSIIAGYSYFTNETQLADVRGIVLIDEIESHLHHTWQADIMPLLKGLFPNTTFFVTTHSAIVLTQLRQNEAYRLVRNSDGIVQSKLIKSPNTVALVDLLKDAFNVDLNRLKIQRTTPRSQQDAKRKLLELIQSELEEGSQ